MSSDVSHAFMEAFYCPYCNKEITERILKHHYYVACDICGKMEQVAGNEFMEAQCSNVNVEKVLPDCWAILWLFQKWVVVCRACGETKTVEQMRNLVCSPKGKKNVESEH